MDAVTFWRDVYLAFFLVGLLSTLALFALGMVHLGHGHAGHGHGGHGHGHGDGHAGSGGGDGGLDLRGMLSLVLPVLNVTAMLGLALCGGCAGYVALRLGARVWTSWIWAIVVGLLGAQLLAWVMRLLARAEAGVVVPEDRAGTIARVVGLIAPGRLGEIAFARPDGSRQSLPARCDDPRLAIDPGAKVVVVRVERGTAYVRPQSERFEDARRG